MLPKKYRLTKQKDFKKTFKQGKYYSQDFMALKITKNNLGFSRFSFIIGLKVSKKAVVRNKIRRQLHEIIRLKLTSLKIGYDIIFLAKLDAVDRGYREIEEVLIILLKKAKILKK